MHDSIPIPVGRTEDVLGRVFGCIDKSLIRTLAADTAQVDLARHELSEIAMGIVGSGIVGALQETADGRSSYCALFHAGDFFDLRQRRRGNQGRIMPLTSVTLLVPVARAFDTALAGSTEFSNAVIVHLCDQHARLRAHAADLSSKTPLERVVSVLFEFLARQRGGSAEAGRETAVLDLPMMRTDIAKYVGIKPETVSRVLRQLKTEDLVEEETSGTLMLRDTAALRRIASGAGPQRATA